MKISKKETKNWKALLDFGDKNYYPSRPADEELLLYEKNLKKLGAKKGKRVFILGATAALRDIALKLGCDVTTVDINKKVIQRMNGYMEFKNHPNEIILNGNWLTMKIKKNYYDFVIGDASLNNIDWKDYPKLLRRTRYMLKKDGYFLHRTFSCPINLKPRKAEDIIEEFRKTNKWRDLKYNLRFHLPQSWSKKWYNKRNYKSKWEPYFDYQISLYKKGFLTNQEFDLVHGEAHKLVSIFPPAKKWEKVLNKYFKIVDKIRAKEYSHTIFTPIYVAKRR